MICVDNVGNGYVLDERFLRLLSCLWISIFGFYVGCYTHTTRVDRGKLLSLQHSRIGKSRLRHSSGPSPVVETNLGVMTANINCQFPSSVDVLSW